MENILLSSAAATNGSKILAPGHFVERHFWLRKMSKECVLKRTSVNQYWSKVCGVIFVLSR